MRNLDDPTVKKLLRDAQTHRTYGEKDKERAAMQQAQAASVLCEHHPHLAAAAVAFMGGHLQRALHMLTKEPPALTTAEGLTLAEAERAAHEYLMRPGEDMPHWSTFSAWAAKVAKESRKEAPGLDAYLAEMQAEQANKVLQEAEERAAGHEQLAEDAADSFLDDAAKRERLAAKRVRDEIRHLKKNVEAARKQAAELRQKVEQS